MRSWKNGEGTATGLSAQDLERALAYGVAIPLGGVGPSRSMGPLLRAGVTLGATCACDWISRAAYSVTGINGAHNR